MKRKKITLIVIMTIIASSLGVLLVTQNMNKQKEEVITQTNARDESIQQLEIVNDEINIREDHTTKSNTIGKVKKGEIYTILDEIKDEYYTWYKIKTENEIEGYIAGTYEETKYVELLEVKETEE